MAVNTPSPWARAKAPANQRVDRSAALFTLAILVAMAVISALEIMG